MPEESQTIEGQPFACPKCGAQRWVYEGDHDNGDWCEAEYRCAGCGHWEYVELAD